MTGALSGAGHRPKKCESVQQQIKVAIPDFSWDCYTALLQKCCQDNAVLRLIMAQRSVCVCVFGMAKWFGVGAESTANPWGADLTMVPLCQRSLCETGVGSRQHVRDNIG
jgi:hypothetical protein